MDIYIAKKGSIVIDKNAVVMAAVRLKQPHGSIRCVNEIKACKRRALQRAGYDAATSLARLLSFLSPLRLAYILLQTLRGN